MSGFAARCRISAFVVVGCGACGIVVVEVVVVAVPQQVVAVAVVLV
jgi:hypothetical protein